MIRYDSNGREDPNGDYDYYGYPVNDAEDDGGDGGGGGSGGGCGCLSFFVLIYVVMVIFSKIPGVDDVFRSGYGIIIFAISVFIAWKIISNQDVIFMFLGKILFFCFKLIIILFVISFIVSILSPLF